MSDDHLRQVEEMLTARGKCATCWGNGWLHDGKPRAHIEQPIKYVPLTTLCPTCAGGGQSIELQRARLVEAKLRASDPKQWSTVEETNDFSVNVRVSLNCVICDDAGWLHRGTTAVVSCECRRFPTHAVGRINHEAVCGCGTPYIESYP